MTIVLLTVAIVIAVVAFIANWMARDVERRELKSSAQREANGSNSTSMYRHVNRK